ncbi:MAG: M1 family metallopeptidase [Flavobacteriales bacterium]
MMKHFLFSATALLANCAFAQSDQYFQQEVNYTIHVTLDDKAHMLRGDISFEYINNSPDTLHELIIHLWPNAYKNAKTAMSKQQISKGNYFMLWAAQTDKGYIDSIDFKVNNAQAEWEYYEDYEDIALLMLAQPLMPGGALTVSTPFKVKLPSGSISRLGHVGESYQITQWYPKPAVYDMDGWHEMPYLTQGEFYSEYGSFDVSITLPSNYVVGATGVLQNEEELKWLDELAAKPIPDYGKGIEIPEYVNKFPASDTTTKTLRYKQSNVHDFGWFADKRWLVRKGEVELPHTKKKVTTYAMFTPENAEVWEKAGIKSINDGLYYYSLYSGDYPYDFCTAVDGTISAGGGMEYPMVTVIGNAGTVQSLATVIIHEVGHNWFYGILGSNERDNAWMDEGINSFFETRALLKSIPDASALAMIGLEMEVFKRKLQQNQLSYRYLTEELAYLISARGNNDQPMQLPADIYTNTNYGTIVYKKTAIAFNYLMNYLGEEMMNRCMADYYHKWKFKHPGPDDIREVFEKTSGKDLSWFFETLVNTTGYVDAQASSIRRRAGGKCGLTLFNNGDIASPVSVDVLREGTLVQRTWLDGFAPQTWQTFEINAMKGDVIKLNNIDGIPEIDKKNNTIRTSGILRRVEPIRLKMLTSVDNPAYSQIFWNPLVGWNEYNKWMLGLQLHNQTIPLRNFTWSVAPMYSIATNNVNGFAKAESYNGKIGLGVRAQKFSYDTRQVGDATRIFSYQMVVPYFRANLFSQRLQKDWSGVLRAEYFVMAAKIKKDKFENEPLFTMLPYEEDLYLAGGELRNANLNHLRIKLNLAKKFLRSEARWESTVEGGDYTNFALFHQHALSYDYVYRGKGKKKILTRLYYGGGGKQFLLNSGGQNGRTDYLYDGLHLGRTELDGLLSQQFQRTQGAIPLRFANAYNKHLLTLNAEMELPVGLPLSVYGGIAFGENADGLAFGGQPTWVAGVSVPLIRNIFEVYVPLVYSEPVNNYYDANDVKFGQRILFQLNLDMANPFQLIRKVK